VPTAAFWGLIQGLTEFLPISSSGHLVLVPALFGMEEPDLATSALLHLGTLAAVIWYYRSDLRKLTRVRTDAEARLILKLLVVGTIPAAVIGLTLRRPIEIVFDDPRVVAGAEIVTGLILVLGLLLPAGLRRLAAGRIPDALAVGIAQAFALIPGISRSGMTITAGMAQGFERIEAARYAFLLAVPSIAGAGFLEGLDLLAEGGFEPGLLVGVAVAAVSGYAAIVGLLGILTRVGMAPFAVYCIVFGCMAYVLV
jgi:undecaprenyl-diphosphatase